MSLFISVSVDRERCQAGQPCTACVTVCPVTVFAREDGGATVIGANEDECILCDLCLQCPTDAITIRKLYTGQILTSASRKG